MRDSDNASPPKWGRIFIGTKDSELHDVEAAKSRAWTAEDEERYLMRVRARAEEMAKDILSRAEAQAINLRQEAHDQGYAEGIQKAEAELEGLRSSMAETVNAVLGAIEGQCSSIFGAWREDLTALLRLALEKTMGIAVTEERAAMLEALYVEAVKTLEKHRSINVRVNPEDEPVVADIINTSKERFPDLVTWKVLADKSITPGGIIVESESSLADNTIESRKAAINTVLENLSLPAS